MLSGIFFFERTALTSIFFKCPIKRVIYNILTLLASLIRFRLLQPDFIFDKYDTMIAAYLFAQIPS